MTSRGGNGAVFGQAMRKKKGKSNYQRQFGGGGAKNATVYRSATTDAETAALKRRQRQLLGEQIDAKLGIERYAPKHGQAMEDGSTKRRGWLYNIQPTSVTAAEDATTASSGGPERSGLDLYFSGETKGGWFKTTVLYRPYFYVMPDLTTVPDSQKDIVLELLLSSASRLCEGSLHSCEVVHRVDLDQPNHLAPRNKEGRPMLKLVFDNVNQLTTARQIIREVVDENKKQSSTAPTFQLEETTSYLDNPTSLLIDLREYDVPYVVRVCTDMDIRAGTWYDVEPIEEHGDRDAHGDVRLVNPDRESKADPTFFAFDIECYKEPLKFPNAERDEIFMISYMVRTPEGGKGFLITSKEYVNGDIPNFEYSPSAQYPGPFTIFNEPDERALLDRFFQEYRRWQPQIVVTYNGDFFDWPYVQTRAQKHGFDMYKETGVQQIGDEFRGRTSVHLDAFHWVQRDSYLPQGAQGLKAVTKYKLGYDPVEVDPEDMVRFAREKPVHMATYSVSDAVATYYLYEKYVHLFIFSLSTIIPMGPEDVLRKGSGTLCEALLMVQACQKSIVCPNKSINDDAKFHKGHLLESETYIGGKVECLETGVYRSDVEYDFDLKPAAFQQLIDNIDRDLQFSIEVEGNQKKEDIVNYNEIRSEIVSALEKLRERPKRVEKPYIYHLDVGAMYPNIILSNRLQPSAIVDDAACAACEYNQERNGCKRRMDWIWRGDYSPATRLEYERTKEQLSRETHDDGLSYYELEKSEQQRLVSDRLKGYSRRAYQKTKITEESSRKDVVCMRENDFYVNTVRQFRDRRYEFKALNKTWKKRVGSAKDPATKKECEDKVLVYDSLQVAHKCILNSFYGYVMRKGARWRSMEMAGIVTKTGSDIITQARVLVEQIGRPLELDTDGIWCILPHSFPDVYTFHTKSGTQLKLEYPCVMLNADVHNTFTNHQYQTLVDPQRGVYETRSECSIFFEVDGPYRCMVLPASTEEGKLLKKRYAVFNFDGSLAELKGFELKRRGELELIKTFQSQVFERFLDGDSLASCYDSVADVANHWIDVIETRGESLDDDELVTLISENRNMSRQLDDYGDQKGTSQTTARRLGEFLGPDILKDKGLNCKFIIAEQPYGAPVTDRAIPTAIWKAEPEVMRSHLCKWLKAPGLSGDALDMRNILDWDYYLDRLGKTIQKIITIPAALQKVPNPVPRVAHPDWLCAMTEQMNDRFQQQSLAASFGKVKKTITAEPLDIEGTSSGVSGRARAIVRRPRTKEATKADVPITPLAQERLSLSKDNFNSWLAQKKGIWRSARLGRKSVGPLQPGSQGSEKRQKKAVSVEGFVRDAALTLEHQEWQIVEARELTTFGSSAQGEGSSGELAVWVLVGGSSLQKIQVTVPRVVYVATRVPVHSESDEVQMRKAERHLPRGWAAPYLYEVTMSEHVFRTKPWADFVKPSGKIEDNKQVLETMFESSTTAVERALTSLGSVCKLKPNTHRQGKSFTLSDLQRVETPKAAEYLGKCTTFQRLFLYIRMNARTRTGMVALYSTGRYTNQGFIPDDSDSGSGSFNIGATCHIWIVKPGSGKGQRNLSKKQCETLFSQLTDAIQDVSDSESDYSCVSPDSQVDVAKLRFVDNDVLAFAGANEAINHVSKAHQGPTMLMLNSCKPVPQLRRHMSSLANMPVVPLCFPPGPAHNPNLSTLPALNWEQPIVQLCYEAYLFTMVVSFPKRLAYARYGQLPVGNLGQDENTALFDVSISRILQKNRAVSWSSTFGGGPDLGVKFLPLGSGGSFPLAKTGALLSNQEDIWGDEDELVSPVVRRPGCYRSICVDIDVHDLAIAALTELSSAVAIPTNSLSGGGPSSPTSVALFTNSSNLSAHLGDEMSTAVSLPMVRSLVSGWLRDAITANSVVADELLHHIYRMLSTSGSAFHDPALHRVVHSLMKNTFTRLLGELQRLGCSIVYASFHKIIVSTSKIKLADAEEYINFVIDTARKRAAEVGEQGDALSRVALRPRQFHSHFIFLDEYNYGTVQLERVETFDVEEENDLIVPEGGDKSTVVVPSVVTAWSIMNYLGSSLAQEYFRAILGRFSKEVYRKQMELSSTQDAISLPQASDEREKLVAFKKKLVKKNLASYLTRALGEIAKDEDELVVPPLRDEASHPISPGLEFIKAITYIMELDEDVGAEVRVLRRSLLAQLGVAEYAKAAKWENPCPTFMLPDIFCSECNESRDVNLCYIPLSDEDEKGWLCEDCGAQYDTGTIESRLIDTMHRKLTRYQLQDVRCSKTNRAATRTLKALSQSSATLDLERNSESAEQELQLVLSLAKFHGLDSLEQVAASILEGHVTS